MTKNKKIFSACTLSILSIGMAMSPFAAHENVHAINTHIPTVNFSTGFHVTRNHNLYDPMTGYTSGPGRMNIGFINIGGREAFCIDATTQINNINQLYEYKGYSGFEDIGYSRAQIDKMQKIATVGYGMDKSPEMRVATQIKIWETRFPGAYSDIPAGVQSKMREIDSRLAVLDTPVKFELQSGNASVSGTSVNLKGYGEENAVTIVDKNNVLQHYKENKAQTNANGYHFEKKGNTLKIWADKSSNKFGMAAYDCYYLHNEAAPPIAFVNKGNQSCGFFGKSDPVSFRLNVSVNNKAILAGVNTKKTGKGNIRVEVDLNKTDEKSGKPIKDVQFDVYRQELTEEGETTEVKIGNLVTDEKGHANATFDQEEEITVESSTRNYITNADELSDIELREALGTGAYKTKAEAEKAVNDEATKILNHKISEYQKQEFSYVIRETATGKGFYLDPSTNTYESDPVEGSGKVLFSIKNKPVEGQITLSKTGKALVDAKHNEKDGINNTDFQYEDRGLYGAEYDLIAAEDITHPADGSVIYKKGTVVEHVKTDKAGTVTTSNLPLGKYSIKETKAPNGYVINPAPTSVELKYAGQEVALVSQNANFQNNKTDLDIDLIKKSAETGNKLQGAKFGLYAAEDIRAFNPDEYVIFSDGGVVTANPESALIKKGTLIETAISDENGLVNFVSNLPLGKYEVKELEAPKGYVLSDEVHSLDGTYKDDKTEIIELDKEIENDFEKVDVKVNKVDEQGKPITGKDFEFGLFEDDCKTEITKVNGNDETGTATFEDLTIGDYCIKETKSPNGYQLSKETVKVEVQEYGNVLINGEEAKPEGETVLYSIDYKNTKDVTTSVQNNSTKYLQLAMISGGVIVLIGLKKLVEREE